ncbi:TolC family protein [Reichenbachiella ulvae]|uniref:TolC family protein n=1 Tax=Reichenbachiella ulvae TaxID=2980104 RepID=A0ABT3CUY9_9BACT|nr:TolC family protein [Reichenbachiella ulvae]MCV9387515.1 TolC family protein [Reichenbachiella ulvae]
MKKTTYIHINKYVYTALLMILMIGPSFGQDTLKYSLEEVKKEVLNQNWDIRKLEAQQGIAKGRSMQANASFLPSVSLQENYMTTTDPMMAFGIKLRQESIEQVDFNPDLLNDPDRIDNFNTSIQVQQPIFNLDGIYAKKAAQLQYESLNKNKEWLTSQLMIHAKSMYYGLILAEQRGEVVRQSLTSAEEDLKVTQDLYDQGMINDADRMQAELRVLQMQSSLLEADNDLAKLQQQLLHLMGRPAGVRLVPTESIPMLKMNGSDLAFWESRPDLQAAKMQAESAAVNHNSKKSAFLPRVNAFGSYDLHDTQMFGNQADNYTVGVQLKWDLFQGGKNLGSVQSARYEKEYAQMQYEAMVNDAQHNWIELQNAFALAQSQLELAQKSTAQSKALNEIVKDRYAQGLEKTADLLRNESLYLSKQLRELQATHQYLQLLFEIESKSMNDIITQ